MKRKQLEIDYERVLGKPFVPFYLMRSFWICFVAPIASLLAFFILASCSYSPIPLPGPILDPVPVVVPVDPPSSAAVPYSVVEKIERGMAYTALESLVGRPPDKRDDRPGGEEDVAWEATDASGAKRLLVVRIDSSRIVVSRALF